MAKQWQCQLYTRYGFKSVWFDKFSSAEFNICKERGGILNTTSFIQFTKTYRILFDSSTIMITYYNYICLCVYFFFCAIGLCSLHLDCCFVMGFLLDSSWSNKWPCRIGHNNCIDSLNNKSWLSYRLAKSTICHCSRLVSANEFLLLYCNSIRVRWSSLLY